MSNAKPSEDNSITLPDGRTLGYAMYGIPLPIPQLSSEDAATENSITHAVSGRSISPRRKNRRKSSPDPVHTIIYCHGLPGSRLEVSHLHKHALAIGARIISVDRPGIGHSSPWPQLSILDFAEDTKHLLDCLNIQKFHVLAYSAGAPYAFGLAHACQGFNMCYEILSIGIVAGLAPWSIAVQSLDTPQRILANIAHWCPALVGYLLRKEVECFAGQDLTDGTAETLNDSDCKTLDLSATPGNYKGSETEDSPSLSSEDIRASFARNLREVHNGEMKWVLQDVQLVTSDWGFDLSEIKSPRNEKASSWIKLWHGGRDTNIQITQAEGLQELLKQSLDGSSASLTVFPSDTHFTILPERGGYILRSLVSA